MIRKPNLFIIGAMKSGTSSLYEYLSLHPDIFMCRIKEPMYFSREENWGSNLKSYLQLFENASSEIYLGEASTEYTKRPFRKNVAKRLYEFNNEAKLIYLMRDPFERIISQYKFMVREGVEKRSIIEAIKTPSDYLTNSYYAYQLRPYIDLFGKKAIFIDISENLASLPEIFCKNIFRWLNIDTSFVPQNLKVSYHVSPGKAEIIDDKLLFGKLAIALKRFININSFLPKSLIAAILKLFRIKREIKFSSDEIKKQIAIVRRATSSILADWIAELEELTERSYSMWSSCKVETDELSNNITAVKNLNKEIEKVLKELLL